MSRTLLIVEDQVTADNMSRFIDTAEVCIEPYLKRTVGDRERFKAVFVRWPSPGYLAAKHDGQPQVIQNWVRMVLMGVCERSGDFQYI